MFENNIILTGTEFLTMNPRPKNPANARNLNACVIGSSGSGKTRFWLTPQLLQASAGRHGCSYVVVDPKGGTLDQCGAFLQRQGYEVRVFNSIDFSRSMHYNPLSYIRNEADILKFVDTLIANTSGDGKESDPFWRKAETLLRGRRGCENRICRGRPHPPRRTGGLPAPTAERPVTSVPQTVHGFGTKCPEAVASFTACRNGGII